MSFSESISLPTLEAQPVERPGVYREIKGPLYKDLRKRLDKLALTYSETAAIVAAAGGNLPMSASYEIRPPSQPAGTGLPPIDGAAPRLRMAKSAAALLPSQRSSRKLLVPPSETGYGVVAAHRFTYGLSLFDDETVQTMLAVDHKARRQGALLQGTNVRSLDVPLTDVMRADRMVAMASVWPCEEEEAAAEANEELVSDTLMQPAEETLMLLGELEKIGVLDALGDRSHRLSSIDWVREGVSIENSPLRSLASAKAKAQPPQQQPQQQQQQQRQPEWLRNNQAATSSTAASRRAGRGRGVGSRRAGGARRSPPPPPVTRRKQADASTAETEEANAEEAVSAATLEGKLLLSIGGTLVASSLDTAFDDDDGGGGTDALFAAAAALAGGEAALAPSAAPAAPPAAAAVAPTLPGKRVSTAQIDDVYYEASPDVNAMRSRLRRSSTKGGDNVAASMREVASLASKASMSRAASLAEEDEEEEDDDDDDEQEAGNAAGSAASGAGAGAGAVATRPKKPEKAREKASLIHAALERAASTLGRTQQLKALVEGAVQTSGRGSRSSSPAARARRPSERTIDEAFDNFVDGSKRSAGAVGGLGITRLAQIATMRELYVAACAKCGVPPASRILNQLAAPRLTLRHYNLGPKGMAPLAALLPLNTAWRVLSLADNLLQPAGGVLLATALRANSHLTELDLSRNRFGLVAGVRLLEAVADGAGLLHTLRTLRLGGNTLGDGAATALCELLRLSGSLRTLALDDNNLSVATAQPLSVALSQSSLVELDLGWNLLRGPGTEFMCFALASNTTLQVLRMPWNGAGQRGGLALGQMLSQNACLTSMDLSHNGIDATAAQTLAEALSHENRTLTSLELSHNPLGRRGTEMVMAALTNNPTLTSIGLQHTLAGLGGIRDKLGGGEQSGAGAALHFDPDNPEGRYNLNLSKPWDRWVACKLQQLSLQKGEPWLRPFYDDGLQKHFSRASAVPWSEKHDVPTSGTLRLQYKQTQPRELASVHYVLDLGDAAQREVAIQLYQRALVEPGENWKGEMLDGVGFNVDEEGGRGWVVPHRGVLELDYLTFEMKFEQHYALELATPADHAVLQKLCERARADAGDNFVNATLDGAHIEREKLEHAGWSPPRHGLFEADFVCRAPKHVSTRHYTLDLASERDWELAERLRQWAIAEPGENWMNKTIDGESFAFDERRGVVTVVEAMSTRGRKERDKDKEREREKEKEQQEKDKTDDDEGKEKEPSIFDRVSQPLGQKKNPRERVQRDKEAAAAAKGGSPCVRVRAASAWPRCLGGLGFGPLCGVACARARTRTRPLSPSPPLPSSAPPCVLAPLLIAQKEASLPTAGLLEFDYVVLRPREGLPLSTGGPTTRLDMSSDLDRQIATHLRELGHGDAGDAWAGYVATASSADSKAVETAQTLRRAESQHPDDGSARDGAPAADGTPAADGGGGGGGGGGVAGGEGSLDDALQTMGAEAGAGGAGGAGGGGGAEPAHCVTRRRTCRALEGSEELPSSGFVEFDTSACTVSYQRARLSADDFKSLVLPNVLRATSDVDRAAVLARVHAAQADRRLGKLEARQATQLLKLFEFDAPRANALLAMAVHLVDGDKPEVQSLLLASISSEVLRVQVADRLLHSTAYREHIVDWDPSSGLPPPPPPGKEELEKGRRRSNAAAAAAKAAADAAKAAADAADAADSDPDAAPPEPRWQQEKAHRGRRAKHEATRQEAKQESRQEKKKARKSCSKPASTEPAAAKDGGKSTADSSPAAARCAQPAASVSGDGDTAAAAGASTKSASFAAGLAASATKGGGAPAVEGSPSRTLVGVAREPSGRLWRDKFSSLDSALEHLEAQLSGVPPDGDEAGSPTATLGRNSASRRSKAFVNVVREAKTAQGSPAGVGSP